ncbi:MAG: HAMP domain-containing histidine kinase, partial [Chitinispirillia bacterium]|nr:HAMP domain-containing histidine kinase [Chitinispirillia bacterium]
HDLLENEETIRSQIWFKDMVANISHDLKTPLTVLSASLQTLSKHTETRGSPEYQRGVRIAYQKTMDLQRLTQNLFEASRIETGRNFYAPKQESLHRLLAQVESKYNAYLDDNGITLDIVAGNDAGISIDPMKIWSVFDNIIYNAARYTGPGGAISITATTDAGSATVTITDTGCGIAEECLPRIFERFYKVSRGRGAKDGDGGLGLYIVKSIMDGCGGKVRAESTLGKGTSIILTFPCTYRPATEAG